ncbi:MAG: site-specific integrase [Boseongicola sp. SB0675_bin_26]|nr:site-specific integrase [Boseongicola sp. SB0675_bin_26]
MSLTERKVRDLKPNGRQAILWDAQMAGFGCRVSAGGTKVYIISYRADGRKRQAIIGRPSEMSLAEARTLAGRELTAIRQGEPDPLARRKARQAEPTLAEGVSMFFDRYCAVRLDDGRMKAATAQEYRRMWNRALKDWEGFGAIRVNAATKADIEKAVSKRAPASRNRALACLSTIFNIFEQWEMRPQHTNPVRLVEKAREQARDRVLSAAEFESLATALSELASTEKADPYPLHAIRFLALTGWRAGEALDLKWEHIDFDTREITLPDTKTGRQLRRIGEDATDLLQGVPRWSQNPHVFAGHYGSAIGYKRLGDTFRAACTKAGIADARLHDLRRSYATHAAAAGMSVFAIRDLLNHSTLEMANRYVRRAGEAVQQAHDENAARVAAMMGGKR